MAIGRIEYPATKAGLNFRYRFDVEVTFPKLQTPSIATTAGNVF
jgi:hypothetical protein